MRYCYRCNGFGWVDCDCDDLEGCARCYWSGELPCPICKDRHDDAYAVILGILMAIGVAIYFW